MAAYRLDCDRCDWTATTHSPVRAADGRTIAHLYCAQCGEVRACTLDSAPSRGPLGVPLGPRHGQASRFARGLARRLRDGADPLAMARCPVCDATGLLLAPRDGQGPPCPRCGVGRLHARPLAR